MKKKNKLKSYPFFLSLLLLAITISSQSNADDCRRQWNVVITPPTPTSNFFDWFSRRAACAANCTTQIPASYTFSCGTGGIEEFCIELCTIDIQNKTCEEDPTMAECGNDCKNTINPVNLGTGNKFFRELDYQGRGGSFPLSFSRYYNSDSGNWTHSYNQYINFNATTGKAIAGREDGKGIPFLYTGQQTLQGTPDEPTKLEKLSNGWRLTTPGDKVELYDSTGRLTKITSREGVSHTLTYGVNNGSVSVVHDNGAKLLITFDAARRLMNMIDPANQLNPYDVNNKHYRYQRDEFGRLAGVSYPDGALKLYLYEDLAHPTAVTTVVDVLKRNGVDTNVQTNFIEYDAQGRATLSKLAGDVEKIAVTYTSDTETSYTNAYNKNATYYFEKPFNNKRVAHVVGEATTACLGTDSSVSRDPATGLKDVAINDRLVATDFEFNSRGLETERIEALGEIEQRTITTDWHPTYRLPVTITEPNHTTVFEYYPDTALLKKKTQTDTSNFSYLYNSQGQTREWNYTYYQAGEPGALQVKTINGPRTDLPSGKDDITSFIYDNAGNLIEVKNALGHKITYHNYNVHGLPGQIIDANGVSKLLSYDLRQRITDVIIEDPAGNAVTHYDYYENGLLKKVTKPNGSYLAYTYNDAKQLTVVSNNQGEKLSYTPSVLGSWNEEEVMTGSSVVKRQKQQVMNELGRLWKQIGSNGQETTTLYDENNNLASKTTTHPLGDQTTTYTYDPLDRMSSMVGPDDATAAYQYDAQNNLIKATDARSVETNYIFDGFNQLMRTDSKDSGVTLYKYNKAGSLVEKRDSRGITTLYSYDSLNRITNISYPSDASKNMTRQYDLGLKGIGKLYRVDHEAGYDISAGYDSHGNEITHIQKIKNAEVMFQYGYNKADQLTRIIYPSGRVVNYYRDNVGQINRVSTQLASGALEQDLASSITHYPYGPLETAVYGNGLTKNVTLDLDYRPEIFNVKNGSNAIQDLVYSYYTSNDIELITNHRTTSYSQSFEYDTQSRLDLATGAYGTLDYAYDDNGNRTGLIENNGSTTTFNYTIDSLSNKLLQVNRNSAPLRSINYDPAGNTDVDTITGGRALDFTYGADNRDQQVTKNGIVEAVYQYNGDGQRVSKNIPNSPSSSRQFHYGVNGMLLVETNLTGTVKRENIYLEGEPLAVDVRDASALNNIDIKNVSTILIGEPDENGASAATVNVMVSNTGTRAAQDVYLTVNFGQSGTLDSYTSPDFDTNQCTQESTYLTCYVGEILAAGQVAMTLNFTLTSSSSYNIVVTAEGPLADAVPNNNTTVLKPASGGPCATQVAAAGTPIENSLDILRDFRDDILKPNPFGKEFVAFYYRHSPTWAAWLTEHETARQIAGQLLEPVIAFADFFNPHDADIKDSSLADYTDRHNQGLLIAMGAAQ